MKIYKLNDVVMCYKIGYNFFTKIVGHIYQGSLTINNFDTP